SENCSTMSAQPAALPRSNGAGCSFAFGATRETCAIASNTVERSRPLTMTSAPISASPFAAARPIPRVEPVTSASLPERSRSIIPLPLAPALFRRRHDIDFPVSRRAGMAAIEALRRHHQPLGIGCILGHPPLTRRQVPVGCGIADADEAEAL